MKNYFSLVKFTHTIFALPFALTGFAIGVATCPDCFRWKILFLVLACMVFARNAAMAFNRWLDRDIDAANPRTKMREIPAGLITEKSALLFVVFNCLLFVAATFFINRMCFFLSPVALAVVLGYSFTKRFTALCHFVLGVGLSLAPVGAFLAVMGEFAVAPILLGFAVLFWVAGFDIIYALQDEDFDKNQNLHSIPAWLGRARALRFSEILHLGTAVFLLAAVWMLENQFPQVGWMMWLAAGVFLGLLIYQHRLVSVENLSRVNMAFFTTNGFASLIFGTLSILDLFF